MALVDRVKNILSTPKTEWPVIESETPDTNAILTGYVLPLAAIGAIATFIGYGLIGVEVPFVGRVHGMGWGISQALQYLIGAVLGVFLSAYVIDMLAPSFQSEKNLGRAIQLVAYSYTPAWVAGIFMIYPLLGFVAFLGMLYGLYLLYLGLPIMMKTPEDKVIIYIVVAIVVIIVISIVVGLILGAILGAIFGSAMPTMVPAVR